MNKIFISSVVKCLVLILLIKCLSFKWFSDTESFDRKTFAMDKQSIYLANTNVFIEIGELFPMLTKNNIIQGADKLG
jgi:hypothetical protein